MSEIIVPYKVTGPATVTIRAGNLPWAKSHVSMFSINALAGERTYAWFGREIDAATAAKEAWNAPNPVGDIALPSWDLAVSSIGTQSAELHIDAGGATFITVGTNGNSEGFFYFRECTCQRDMEHHARMLCALEKIAAKL